MSICPSCNEERVPGALFCGSCGSRLVSDGPPDPAVDALVGQTLNGTYVLQQRIGSGGMGDVYRAIHNKLDVPVAVKLVKRALLEDPAVVHRFKREARAASRLRHPNVVAVTDFGETADGTLFMVMEFVTGKSLARVIADEGPLPESRVVHIGAQILSALSEAHANDLLHRDLKPENVMLEARRGAPDFVKVLDFGIAKVLTVGAPASTLTQAGLVCGTPGYMSPEQLRGDDNLDPRSDLFAVGVVLYEMLTLELPFDVQTPMEMLHKHLSERIPPPSERSERPVSAALEDLVMRSMSMMREDRPPSADAMREELIGGAGGRGVERDAARDTEQRVATEVLPRRDSRRRPPPTPPPAAIEPTGPPSPASTQATAAPQPRGDRRPSDAGRTHASSERTAARPRPPATPGRTAPAAPGRAGAPQRTSGAPGPGTAPRTPARPTARPDSRFDATILRRLEEQLTRILGPVAPHLTRKASRQAATLGDLCHALSRFLPSRDEQKAFLAWTSSELHVAPARGPTPAASAVTPAVAWDPTMLERAVRDLAVYLGPLARIVVRRICGRAHDLRELYELLALAIPNETEREAFRRAAPPDARHD
ncbi:MAG TPA: protein kinase [Anaeromyxobacteraceae bacterium]|nr:protein kinase [Anaeromyxobacteraceae bacterium]